MRLIDADELKKDLRKILANDNHVNNPSTTYLDVLDVVEEQPTAYDIDKEHNKMCDTCIHKVSKEDIEQIRIDVIAEISREIRLLYGNEYEQQIRAEAIDECISKIDTLEKISFGIVTTDLVKGMLEALKEQTK